MTNLELEPEELKVLEDTLARSISDLSVEIGHTDSHDFKEMLKRRKAVLDQVLDKVKNVAAPA